MPDRIGSNDCQSCCTKFQKTCIVPSVAVSLSHSFATTVTCCWSVLILFLWTTTARHCPGGTSRRYRSSHWQISLLPSAANTLALARSMSSYSAVFAEAFHPSASSSANDDETSSGDNRPESSASAGGSSSKSHHPKESSPNEPELNAREDDVSTCDASNEKMGQTHPENDGLVLFHFDSTTSTQDEAKTIAQRLSDAPIAPSLPNAPGTFCVTATSQSKGRGTTGRQWLGAPGNVFVTIGIPVDVWMTTMLRERRIPLTLLPLKIGDLTATLVRDELDKCGGDPARDARVTVKWPNDVLVDGKKISGTLIETASDWFLIGIGINVAHSPEVPTTGTDYGRPSVSLSDYCGNSSVAPPERDQTARDLGVKLALGVHRWIYEEEDYQTRSTADSIVGGWKKWLDWDAELTMRGNHDDPVPRRVVRLLEVLSDGRIRVAHRDDGREEILVSDYFV